MEKQYSKEYFTLVQENERLVDKPLKTKQLSYFQDALIRFGKNKYNVASTIILLIMILFSIFVPTFTPSRYYEETNGDLMLLPPRVPILENFGILDGYTMRRNRVIDYSTIDPETGLGYPVNATTYKEYIDFNTLTNHIVYTNTNNANVIGGTNNIYIDFGYKNYTVASPQRTFNTGQYIEVEIKEIAENARLAVYFTTQSSGAGIGSWDNVTLLAETRDAGVLTIDPFTQIAEGTSGYLLLSFQLDEVSTTGQERITLEQVVIKNSLDNPVATYTGYSLSQFGGFVVDELNDSGRYARENGYMIVADFRYDAYSALKSPREKRIGDTEYNKILQENPGMLDAKVNDPLFPNKWTFDGDWPIKSVTNVTTQVIGGIPYITYTVQMDGLYALGFEEAPYFIFGTDSFGHDLFVMLWLGLRTSLILGLLGSLVNIIVGVIWGAISAYYGGQVDLLMERFVDIWGSFPQITMIGIISVLMGPGFFALFVFIIYDGWIGAAAITRLQFYRYKGREYVLAARTLGASDARIIFKHILPNALGTIVTRTILSIPSVIFLEVNLSFLGFGIGNGQSLKIGPIDLTGTSIGVILSDGQAQMFAGNYWLIIFPTLIVALLMITFNMFGNALRDALNPQLRGNS